MSSRLYPKAREKFLTGQLSWISGTYRGVLLPESYSPDFTDQFISDVFAGVRIATSDPITSRTATDGYASCDAIRWPLLVDSRRASKIIIYRDTLVETTSDLLCFIDSEDIIGAPVALVGFDYFFMPNALEGGLFRL